MQIRIKWWHIVCAAAGYVGWGIVIIAFAYHDALLSAQEKSKPAPPLPAPEYLKLETAPTFIMDTGSKAPVIELRKCDSQGKCELLVVRESWDAKAKIGSVLIWALICLITFNVWLKASDHEAVFPNFPSGTFWSSINPSILQGARLLKGIPVSDLSENVDGIVRGAKRGFWGRHARSYLLQHALGALRPYYCCGYLSALRRPVERNGKWPLLYDHAHPQLNFVSRSLPAVFHYDLGFKDISAVEFQHCSICGKIGPQLPLYSLASNDHLKNCNDSDDDGCSCKGFSHGRTPTRMRFTAFGGLAVWIVGMSLLSVTRFERIGLVTAILGVSVMAVGLIGLRIWERRHQDDCQPQDTHSDARRSVSPHGITVPQKYLLTTSNYWGTFIARGNESMANVLNTDKQIAIVSALAEGSAIRQIERMTGVHRDTIMRLGVRVGNGCARLLDGKMRNLTCDKLQFDELWGYIGKKQRHVKPEDSSELGDVWTWVAIDAETKLVPAFTVGKRDMQTAINFTESVASRMANRVQVSTDALHQYAYAMELAFEGKVDYAQIVKVYDSQAQDAEVIGVNKTPIQGNPDMNYATTSHVERLNGTTRLHMRRLSRLTYAFSKKLENFQAAVALHFAYYNLVRHHNTLRCTPAMAAGIERDYWTVGELLEAAA